MDIFLEKIVAKKRTGKDYLMITGILLVALFLFFVLQLVEFLRPFFIVVVAAIAYFVYQFVISRNIEYEYILTNGELDIDIIIAQRRRKRIFSANCKDFDILAKLKGGYNDRRIGNVSKKIEAISTIDSDEIYFATLTYKGERTAVLFEPDERMLKSFRTFIPRKIQA